MISNYLIERIFKNEISYFLDARSFLWKVSREIGDTKELCRPGSSCCESVKSMLVGPESHSVTLWTLLDCKMCLNDFSVCQSFRRRRLCGYLYTKPECCLKKTPYHVEYLAVVGKSETKSNCSDETEVMKKLAVSGNATVGELLELSLVE